MSTLFYRFLRRTVLPAHSMRNLYLSEAMLSEKSFVPTKVGIEMDSERIPRGFDTGVFATANPPECGSERMEIIKNSLHSDSLRWCRESSIKRL